MAISLSALAISFSSGARRRATRNPARSTPPVTEAQRVVPWGLSMARKMKQLIMITQMIRVPRRLVLIAK